MFLYPSPSTGELCIIPPIGISGGFRVPRRPPSEQMMEEKCSYILSNHPGHGESGEIKMDEINWPDKTCSFFHISLSRIADPVFLQPAAPENHDTDLIAAGKSPHAVIIGFLDMPEPISGKVILDIGKK